MLKKQASGRDVVRRESERLRPGLFVYAGGRLWRHWHEPLPDVLRQPASPPAAWAVDGASPRAQVAGLLRKARSVCTVRVFVVPPHRGERFPLALAASDGDALLFDPARGRVVRRFGIAALTDDQVALRTRWSRQVPSPGLTVLDDGRRIAEDYITGRRFVDLDGRAQVDVVRKVFRSYTAFVRAEGAGSSRSFVDRILDPEVLERLPAVLRQRLESARPLFAEADHWPLIPTPEDSHWGNVVIADHDRPVFIDSFPLRALPFFYTPLTLIARGWRRSNPSVVRLAFLAGAFDRELCDLFEAAGVQLRPTPEVRETLLTLSLALRDLARADRSGAFDAAAFAASAYARFVRNGLDEPSSWDSAGWDAPAELRLVG